ncbi:hypothetical protein GNP82_09250 [Aliivibrio fischeri]|uniref:restriction endonuclease subunit S n=1 Tax=Aliivibrio fischeri TaxID=668 RepID=UPI0012D86FA4|nr:restriction endonuclease subunit S [Aliivibrio fischeri]MUK37737.1 hypothetical protein [Aliivibrio fischeri]MUL06523.1 hypothetical protein [Aliivibrio fischeri]
MSSLPKGWVETDFDNVIDSLTNGISDKQNKESNGIPVSRIETIADQTINYSKIGFVDNYDDVKAKKYLLNEGDILFSHINSPIHLGKTAIFDGRQELFHGTNLLRIVVNKRVTLSSYFNYYCKFTRAIGAFSLNAQHAVNQSSLNQKKIKAFSIPLPPLAEQKRIVEKLDEVLAQVDTIKVRLDGIPSLLKRFRQSVLASAVSGKLTKEWRGVGSEPFGKQVKLGELLKDGPQNGLYKPSRFYGNGTKIFRIDSFYDGELVDWETIKRVDLEEQEVDKYRVNIDDVLVNRVNSIEYLGKCALVRELPENAVFESNIMRMSIDTEKALPAFVTTFLRSIVGLQELRKNAKLAVNQASINQTDVKNCLLYLPKIEEQKEIVRLVDQYFAFADTIEAQVKKAQARVNNLAQSILAKAFRGELVPQDPNDEPADKLLERIAQARIEAEALAKAAKKAETARKKAQKV